ncbi:endolytic transglycosylase MltG [Limosilactobacillus difficilis]|uniref:endolytic transglycosylase MltG n=1 Tax=Limosilactobacillus difficilis TaxID=2991838 RepID=UPI0024B87E96|nr:endolytic transglycosylase MltG [Limosilactobacillus difficilis]
MNHFSKKQLRRQNTVVLIIIIMMVVLGLTIHQVFTARLAAVNTSDRQAIAVTIPRGATDRQVGAILKQRHLVRSAYVFDYYLETHKTHGVKAGTFHLRRTMTTPQIVAALQERQLAKTK